MCEAGSVPKHARPRWLKMDFPCFIYIYMVDFVNYTYRFGIGNSTDIGERGGANKVLS